MRILLPTGSATYKIVKNAAAGYDADVVETGEIASFLTPAELRALLARDRYDMVIVTGMATASFSSVEKELGVPVFLGPRHAADLAWVLSKLDTIPLSRTVPADEILALQRREEAIRGLAAREEEASCEYLIRGVKIGGSSRMKVLAEVMDAHRRDDLSLVVQEMFRNGADIVDLGFGFDATPGDVARCFRGLDGIPGPLAIDTPQPELIAAGLSRADLVLSLHDGNIPKIGQQVADAGVAAVIVPHEKTLDENLALAREAGISCIIADPLIQPAGSGFIRALRDFPRQCPFPLFFGAGNVVELFDADSPGMNALLAGMAMEVGASVIFTAEHSDKTRGSVKEMRIASEMMVLAKDRPFPKDLGIDLLILKEKRRRNEPPLTYETVEEAVPGCDTLVYDPKGNFRIGIENGQILAIIHGRAIRGTSWSDMFSTILQNGDVSLLDHAAYLGKELYKAELALRFGRSFEQDGDF